MTIAASIQSQRRLILLLVAVLLAGGIAAGFKLPVALFPAVHFPRVVIDLEAGDQSAERMAIGITAPVESSLRALPGVLTVRSVTSRGSAEISVLFQWGQDMDVALLRAQALVAQVIPDLPVSVQSTVRRMDPTVFPCVACSLSSPIRPLAEVRRLAYLTVRPALCNLPGVAGVNVLGGAVEELQVLIDPERARAHGLTTESISQAVRASEVETAVGRLQDQGKLYLVVTDSQARDPDQLGQLVVATGRDGVVRLGEVARIVQGTEPRWTRVRADGHEAVSMEIYQQPAGNTVAISQSVRQQLARLRAALPADVSVSIWYDQSDLIRSSARSVGEAVLIGIILAAGVLLVFLGNWRMALIAAVTVPASLAGTALALHALHLSFNIMTLGGMAAAVGLIIDDAIVMIEHLDRRMSRRDGSTAMDAALEFLRPMAGSSCATIIIFAPLAFLTGIAGSFFTALSLTMAISLGISFLLSMSAVPVLCALVLKPGISPDRESQPSRLSRGYRSLMRLCLRAPYLVVLMVLPLVVAGWWAYAHLGSGFMPAIDEGGFIIDYRAAPGTSLPETDRLDRQIEAILAATPEVATSSRRTGLQLGGGLTEANEGDIFVRLKPFPRRPVEEVMDSIRRRIARDVPGLDVDMTQLMEDLIGDLVGNPHPVEVILSGQGAALPETARKVAAAIAAVRGVVDINDGVILAGDALSIQVDPIAAAHEGLDPAAIATQIRARLAGEVTANVLRGPELIGIRVWSDPTQRQDVDAIRDMVLHGSDGHSLPLHRVAHLDRVIGQPQIDHQDLQRVVSVTARIDNRDLGSTMAELQQVLDQPGMLPSGISYKLGGLFAQQQEAFHQLLTVLVAAFALLFLLLVYLFQSLRIGIALLVTALLSVCGVLIGLRLTGMELNITAMMGLTMVVGIVTEVGVLYASALVGLATPDAGANRLVEAGISRARPIVMTILAAVLALLPLAIGLGQGSEMQRPLAIAIISGLLVQLPLALVVLPMLLGMMRVR